ncbi:MAG: hypothetical protein PHV20_03565 [Bacteroidales bacterium]|nr:hypothetical protein [Bacteroidales bacterium]
MKTLIALVLFVASCNSNAQDISYTDILKYIQAFNYIVNESVGLNKRVIVVDTIVFLERASF